VDLRQTLNGKREHFGEKDINGKLFMRKAICMIEA